MTQFMPKLGYISSCESTLDNVRERVFLVQDNTLNLSIDGDLDAPINLQCIVDRPLDTILVQAGIGLCQIIESFLQQAGVKFP